MESVIPPNIEQLFIFRRKNNYSSSPESANPFNLVHDTLFDFRGSEQNAAAASEHSDLLSFFGNLAAGGRVNNQYK